MPEPIYGVDADGVTHYWYPDRSRKNTTKGWSGCGQKDHADFVSFSYTIDGDVTCIGCLATEGEGEMQGLLHDLTRSIEEMKKRGIKLNPVDATLRISQVLGVPRELLHLHRVPSTRACTSKETTMDHFFTTKALMAGLGKPTPGVAYDAPEDHTESPQYLRDTQGIVHSVVRNDNGVWCYCDITVLRDWLLQDGKNVVSKDTPITCLICLMDGHEP